jgi:hypothetical protein
LTIICACNAGTRCLEIISEAARRVWQTLTVSLPVLLAVVEEELQTLDQVE